ncbi:MAG: hypothetical protein J6N52_13270 [Clostridia bacterium]|nr:hypothetical protein [Clostridia bacterium]
MRKKLFLFIIISIIMICPSVRASYIYGNELLIDTGFESKRLNENLIGSNTWRPYYDYNVAYTEIVEDNVRSGSKALRFLNAGGGYGRGVYYTPKVLSGARAGDTYEFCGWFKTDNTSGAELYIYNAWEHFSGSPIIVGTEWTYVTAQFTVTDPSTAFSLRLGTNLTMNYKISDYSDNYNSYRDAVGSDNKVSFMYADDLSFKKVLGGISQAKSVVSRNGVSAVIDNEGKLWMWGDNSSKQINSADEDYFNEPYFIMDNIVKVACGDGHTAVLTGGGDVYGWGRNDFGQISDNRCEILSEPCLMAKGAKDISAGDEFTVAVNYKDELYGRGRGNYNSFGGPDSCTWSKTYTGVKAVEAAGAQTFIIDNKGDLYGIGYNANGQLGLGTYLSPYRFTKIMSDAVQVSANDDYTLVITSNNELYGFGWNKYGYLGDFITDTDIPVKLAEGIHFAGAGEKAAFIISNDGKLVKMGGSNQGLYNSSDSIADILCDGVTIASGDDNVLMLQNGKLMYYDGSFKEIELFTTENGVYTIEYCGIDGGSFNVKIPAVKEAEVVTAITAFYRDGTLVKVKGDRIFPNRDVLMEIKPYSDCDMCKVMLWKNISDMTPKADSLELHISSFSASAVDDGDNAIVPIDGFGFESFTENDGNVTDYYVKASVFNKYIEKDIV